MNDSQQAELRTALENIFTEYLDGQWNGNMFEEVMALLLETDKAYGGCHNCFGKAYSTVRSGSRHGNTVWGIKDRMKFCTCDRGKQLEKLMAEADTQARQDQIIVDSLSITLEMPITDESQVIDWRDRELAALEAQGKETP